VPKPQGRVVIVEKEGTTMFLKGTGPNKEILSTFQVFWCFKYRPMSCMSSNETTGTRGGPPILSNLNLCN